MVNDPESWKPKFVQWFHSLFSHHSLALTRYLKLQNDRAVCCLYNLCLLIFSKRSRPSLQIIWRSRKPLLQKKRSYFISGEKSPFLLKRSTSDFTQIELYLKYITNILTFEPNLQNKSIFNVTNIHNLTPLLKLLQQSQITTKNTLTNAMKTGKGEARRVWTPRLKNGLTEKLVGIHYRYLGSILLFSWPFTGHELPFIMRSDLTWVCIHDELSHSTSIILHQYYCHSLQQTNHYQRQQVRERIDNTITKRCKDGVAGFILVSVYDFFIDFLPQGYLNYSIIVKWVSVKKSWGKKSLLVKGIKWLYEVRRTFFFLFFFFWQNKWSNPTWKETG